MKLHEALVVVDPSRWHSLLNKGLIETLIVILKPFSLNQRHHLEESTNTTNASLSFMKLHMDITPQNSFSLHYWYVTIDSDWR